MGFEKGKAVLKYKPEDFIVEEIDIKGNISEISESVKEFGKQEYIENLKLDERRDFIHMDVEKINIDHFSLIDILSCKLSKRQNEIGYAGAKDKKAWTCQRMSIFNPDIDKIKKFNHEKIKIKKIKWGKHKIKIGDLKGNRFKVFLRNADSNALKLLNRVRNTEYVPNFFGRQRFGSLREDNHIIGKLILKKKYKEAVFSYLCGYGNEEDKEIIDAKKRLKKEKDISNASKYFPKKLCTENNIISYLNTNKEDYKKALLLIGEKIIFMMCQSVQSKLFNDILEKAIEINIINKDESIGIIGYNYVFSKRLGHIEKLVLKQNDIKIEDFKNNDFNFLSLSASERKAFIKYEKIEVEVSDDEIYENSKKISLKFNLDSGGYATTLLEYFFELEKI
jgi:tRNA pseudouridine13 synthase